MDWIKIEPEVDPLGLQPHDSTHETEDSKALIEERNVSNLQEESMKTEWMGHSCVLTSDINAEHTPMPFSFAVVKCEIEDAPKGTSSPVLKSEVDKDLFHLDRVQQEQKVEVSSDEDKVFSERRSLCKILPYCPSHGSQMKHGSIYPVM
ncbi:uncharacterized protein [Periplaneta americana]|uniref:uncharacterized protein isoform X5 n=1 Tax=Periplaneta americana TaxID=6978 RepID=UPI0037E80CBE